MENLRRTDRVGELIKIELSRILREEANDPRLELLSITRVEMTSDLKHAWVYVSPMQEGEENSLNDCLIHARGFLQKRLASYIKLRYTPIIEFRIDDSIKRGAHIMELLEQIKKEKETP